jgi:membrane protein
MVENVKEVLKSMLIFLKNLFIYKPMKLNYILTLIAEFPVLIYISWNIYKDGIDDALKVFLAILLLAHTVGSIVFMIENKDDLNQRLGNFSEQLYLEQSPISLEIFKKMLLYGFHYIVIIICFVEISDYFFLRDQANILFLAIPMLLSIERILYVSARISPFIVFVLIIVPVGLFSVIGIENGVLKWTFLLMVITNCIFPLFDTSIKYLLPKRFEMYLNDEKIKRRLQRKKYWFLFYLPFLYLALQFSELFTSSDFFKNLINNIPGNSNLYCLSYTVYSSIVKMLAVTFSMVIFDIPIRNLLESIARFLLNNPSHINNTLFSKRKFCKTYNGGSQRKRSHK